MDSNRRSGMVHIHAVKVTQMIPSAKINGITPIEAVTGETPYISEYVDTNFYGLVW